MKIKVIYLLTGLIWLHFITGCAQENPVLLSPKSELELTDGTECIGVFDKSREILHLSCEEEENEKIIYLNGEKQLSVPNATTLMLYDIAKEDAYLELVAAAPVVVNSFDYLRVHIYRVQPEGIVDLPVFPQVNDNSFLISDWYWLSFREGVVQVLPEVQNENQYYQLMPEGYFVPWKEEMTVINADGKSLYLPEKNVAIDKDSLLGVAFEPVYTLASTIHYKVYHSLDGGINWSLIAEDFMKESAEFDYIYISDENTIYCFFETSSVTGMQSVYISKDGGMTWSCIGNIGN